MQATAIFQRTESGRSEIKHKMHGLTQSERLALIVIDGVSTYGELRAKLKGLSQERFDRAVEKLLQKSFVIEVLLDDGQNIAEEFDAKTIDTFLHQDPMDPLTIMAFDPEEEFDLDMSAEGATTLQHKDTDVDISSSLAPAITELITPVARPCIIHVPNEVPVLAAVGVVRPGAVTASAQSRSVPPLKIASVDFYVPLEPVARPVLKAVPPTSAKNNPLTAAPPPRIYMTLDESVSFVTRPDKKPRWVWLLLFAVAVAIAISVAFIYFR